MVKGAEPKNLINGGCLNAKSGKLIDGDECEIWRLYRNYPAVLPSIAELSDFSDMRASS